MSDQLVDVFTKVLPFAKFNTLLHKLGMSDQVASLEGDVKYLIIQLKSKLKSDQFEDAQSQHS